MPRTPEQLLRLGFVTDSGPVARASADDLRNALLNGLDCPGGDVRYERRNEDAADFGAVLAIVLAGPAVVEVVRQAGHIVAEWINRNEVDVEIISPDGTTSILSGDASAVSSVLEHAILTG